MIEFCTKHESGPEVLSGAYYNRSQEILYSHLLYDDRHRIVYCYVPKTGCTNMKQAFAVINGLVREEELNNTSPDHPLLFHTHRLTYLSHEQRQYRLKSYYKFVIVRDPLERLVSAYRNKLDNDNIVDFFRAVQMQIIVNYRKKRKQVKNGKKLKAVLHPTFPEFIDYMVETPFGELDDHFLPVTEICQPCSIHYDFYANFKLLSYDVEAMFHLLGIPQGYYTHSVEHPNRPTEQLLTEFFSQLSDAQVMRLMQKLSHEQNFYQSLYPEEPLP